jgi:LmbE family N-acetylglucosaminyl deacetylase
MSDEPRSFDDIDQEIRINELREAAREAGGGEMTGWESPDCPPHIAEQFWENVLAYESADKTCHFIQLEQRGVTLPRPEELDDAALTSKLWEVIRALANMNVFLSQTDHWSDRELYEHMWHETLREITMDLPPNSGWTHHIDFLSSGSDEDNFLYMKYYADEEYRDRWHRDWPDDPIPDHVDPPYDRDSKLPQAPEP